MEKISSDLNTEIKLFKKNIEYLITSGDLENSKKLIAEFQLIKDKDIEIQNMKAIISIMENSLDDAERFLWEGISIEPDSADTLFNLAYLYEIKGDRERSINFYRQAYQKTEDLERKFQIKQILSQFENIEFSIERKFIVLSSCPWGVMLQRPHQIARALSRLGYKVDYIQPSIEVEASNEKVTTSELMKFSEDHIRQYDLIKIHNPVSAYYEENYLLNNYSNLVQDLINESDEEVILICYLPSQINILNQLSGRFKVVYECVDDHSDLEHSYWSNKQDREFEIQILDRADVITTTSNALYLTKSIQSKNKNVYLSKNAVNVDDFTIYEETKLPDDLQEIPSPRICYIGAVDSWFDKELFYELVRANKDKSFVVIGPVREGILNQEEDNLYILGLKEHGQLSSYLEFMDVGIIPFKDDTDIIINCDPIKLYEYVMSGLPVVATNMPELPVGLDFIKISNNSNSFNQNLKEALVQKIEIQDRLNFISRNTWELRGKNLLEILSGETEGFAHNIVLSELSRAWLGVISRTNNPLLKSLYSLTFAESDPEQFYKLAKESYEEFKISFSLKNFIYSAVMNNKTLECTEEILGDSNVRDIDKAELLFLLENNEMSCLKIRLLHIANKYVYIKQLLVSYSEENEEYYYNLANYYFDNGFYDQAVKAYRKNFTNHFNESPILNQNMCELLIKNGDILESRGYKKKEKLAIDKYIRSLDKQEGMRCRFSIVIPTRNSHNVLKYTVMTCLRQEFDDYEVVISDNSNNDFTESMIKEFNNPKIKYFRPENELSMTDNFNFAISRAEGEYILVLGSDDGLLLHALNTLDQILYSTNISILKWNSVSYCWPDVKLEGQENLLYIPNNPAGKIAINTMKYNEIVNRILNFELPYSSMPMLYCNAIVHRDAALKLRDLTGTIYNGLIPDVYSGFALACIQEEFSSIEIPITIGGSSGKSNGISFIKPNLDSECKAIQEDFIALNDGKSVNRFKIIPDVPNVIVAVAEAFLTLKNSLVEHSEYLDFNRKKMIQICADELDYLDINFPIYLQRLYGSLDDDPSLKNWFVENYIDNLDYYKRDANKIIPARKFKGFTSTGMLVLDMSEFNVTDVYGAAVIFGRVTGW
jgi:glycosyltransferase involved in cell wall biosynthesis